MVGCFREKIMGWMNMVKDHIQLTSKEILEKDFRTSMRGYNQAEVDEFLDKIIKDYNNFNQYIQRLEEEVQQLKKTKNHIQSRQSVQPNHQANYDILKRLSNLEKEVFGRKS